MFTEEQLENIVEYVVTLEKTTKIYIGTDSVRKKMGNKMVARYATVLIVHKNGREGCRVFSHISFEDDYDEKANRPNMRMMNEVRKTADAYLQISPLLDDFEIEIHCDISSDPKNGSHVAYNSAMGYIKGVTGIEPKMKPDAWAAMHGADYVANNTSIAA